MEAHGVDAVAIFGGVLQQMLSRADAVKPTTAIEPPLTKGDFDELLAQVDQITGLERTADRDDGSKETEKEREKKSMRFAIVETAIRDIYNQLLATHAISAPGFVQIWNLLDIISILSDNDQCDPALMFWLVEELLDSQTIDGCRSVFDYLESRRERITAKHFKQKNLVILRSCNELLRRLSRAEDTAFCGRVFIFLFQSFPLGDKSSVNLRGEYHVENVTTFDEGTEVNGMDVEMANATDKDDRADDAKKSVSFDSKDAEIEAHLTPDALYPIFWSLQQSFSQPKKLFDREHFTKFRDGLEATVTMFKAVKAEQPNRNAKTSEEVKKGTKRKRGHDNDDLLNVFNPKYLTNRDLFELEISDLSFRRHVLVQALIIMDFLLSLSSKAKQKLSTATTQNKSVMYQDQTLSEDDAKWAQGMKNSIADYLKRGAEGPFFYRMVETVLSRDKNWVRWKVENCPPIARPPLAAAAYMTAKGEACKSATNKRLRPKPMGSLELSFMTDTTAGDRLRDATRSAIPDIKSFKNKIALDEMDLEMADDEETKKTLTESISSKSWRALRIARQSKLSAFDRIDDAGKIDIVFEDVIEDDEAEAEGEDDVVMPADRRAIVICGAHGVGKTRLINMLVERHGRVFSKVRRHATKAIDDESEYQVVSPEKFNMLRDGDSFIEYRNDGSRDVGTSSRAVDDISSAGKVAVMELGLDSLPQVKDSGLEARFVLVEPESTGQFETWRREASEETPALVRALEKEMAAFDKDLVDTVIVNSRLETALQALDDYIFERDADTPMNGTNGSVETPKQRFPEVNGRNSHSKEDSGSSREGRHHVASASPGGETPKYSRIEVVDMSR